MTSLAQNRDLAVGGLAGWRPAAIGVAVLVAVAAALGASRLGAPPEFDELYHILAARGWLEHGRFAIAEGEYRRAGLFTWLIAQMFAGLGDDPAAGRLPSLAAYAATAVALFLWLRGRASPLAAWLAALLLVTSPFMLQIGTIVRFYAVQVLAFFLAVVAIEIATRAPAPDRWRRAALIAAAALLLGLATYLQEVTLLGILGLGLWLLLDLGVPRLRAMPAPARRRLLLAAGALAVIGTAALYASGALAAAWAEFRWTPEFQRGRIDELWYYHLWLVLYYPTLWTLLPVLAVLALPRTPRLVGLCAVVFGVAFVLNSLGGRKDVDYLAYALPFLFALMGLGLAALWPLLAGPVTTSLSGWLADRRPPFKIDRAARVAAAALIAFVILANGAVPRVAAMLAGVRLPPQPPLARWDLAAPELAPWLGRADVVVTTDELSALYYLGDYDVLISTSRLSERREPTEFARDRRTGRPIIGAPASLQALMGCFPSGIVVSDRTRMEATTKRTVAALLASETQPLPLPASWSIDAFVWEGRPVTGAPATCEKLIARQAPAAPS